MSSKKVSHEALSADSMPVNGPASETNLDAFGESAPPSSVTTDFDLDAFRASEAPVAAPVDAGIDAVRVEKPRKLEFVFIHPEWRDYVYIIPGDFKSRREAHLVLPKIAAAFPNICRRVLVVAYCTEAGNYYLWPVPQEDTTGRVNEYNKSAMRQIVKAAGRWCQFEANMENQTYNLYEATDQREAPGWPPEGLPFLIKKAFEDRIITTSDHPVLTRLRGRRV